MRGLCAGRAGQGGAHGLAPPPAPLPTLLPAALGASRSERLPAMTGAPALALLLLGQLLTTTSAQVSVDPRVLMGSGIGPDIELYSLGQLEPLS